MFLTFRLLKILVEQGYHSGGAGYVLSRESLRRFAFVHQSTLNTCSKDGGSEDVEIARCLRKLGVYPGKSLDDLGRERFHPLPFSHHIQGLYPDWLYDLAENPLKKVCQRKTKRFVIFVFSSLGFRLLFRSKYFVSLRFD